MIKPWYEGLKDLGLLCLGRRRLKEDGIKAYKVSEVANKRCSLNPAPSGPGYPVKVLLLEPGQWHPSLEPQG